MKIDINLYIVQTRVYFVYNRVGFATILYYQSNSLCTDISRPENYQMKNIKYLKRINDHLVKEYMLFLMKIYLFANSDFVISLKIVTSNCSKAFLGDFFNENTISGAESLVKCY